MKMTIDPLDKDKLLELYPPYTKVNGPYTKTNTGRLFINLYATGILPKTMYYAKALIEIHLNRILNDNEEADHIDRNRYNDTIQNLRVITKIANRTTTNSSKVYIKFNCMYCGKEGERLLKQYLDKQVKLNRRGPFCNRSCATRYKNEH